MAGLSVRRGSRLGGSFRPPGDKSISHRAVLFGAIASGETTLAGLNPGEDVGRSVAAAEALGARVIRSTDAITIRGTAGTLVQPVPATIDCGNSGTTLRLLAGLLAAQPLEVTLTGDASLRRRPVQRVIDPLRRMGATLSAAEGDRTPPLVIRGGSLRAIHYDVPVASAQVATAVLLAGLGAAGRTSVVLPGAARDHTERMLGAFGVALEVEPAADGGRRTTLAGPARLAGTSIRIPGDFSSAAFLLAAAAATPGARVRAEAVGVNPTRTGFLDVLEAMGARVRREAERMEGGEPVADVELEGPATLVAFDVPAAWAPRLIDEAPAWAVVASAATGTSRMHGAAELRVKESDRIGLLCENLRRLGIACEEHEDGLSVSGSHVEGGVEVRCAFDHRMVMAFAALGARAAEPVTFDDASHAATSFPGFFATLAALGAVVEGTA